MPKTLRKYDPELRRGQLHFGRITVGKNYSLEECIVEMSFGIRIFLALFRHLHVFATIFGSSCGLATALPIFHNTSSAPPNFLTSSAPLPILPHHARFSLFLSLLHFDLSATFAFPSPPIGSSLPLQSMPPPLIGYSLRSPRTQVSCFAGNRYAARPIFGCHSVPYAVTKCFFFVELS